MAEKRKALIVASFWSYCFQQTDDCGRVGWMVGAGGIGRGWWLLSRFSYLVICSTRTAGERETFDCFCGEEKGRVEFVCVDFFGVSIVLVVWCLVWCFWWGGLCMQLRRVVIKMARRTTRRS